MFKSFVGGHALIMGMGSEEDLPNTVDDARGLAEILKDPGRCAYPADQVELLTGENANRTGMLSGLENLANRADEKSTVVIYFSGHGYQVKSSIGDFYYLMPFGYNIERLKDTAISGTEFAERLKAIKAQKLLLLLDCCHAGGMAELKAPGLQFAKAPLPAEAQSLMAQGRGRVIIASSREDELSWGGKPYSAFTLALIEAFCGLGASKQDGFVRAADLAMYAREKVPARTKGRQHPILHFQEADNFVLAYYSGGEAEPKGLPFDQEPEIEPEPGAWGRRKVFDQRGQIMHSPQTNIAGNVYQHIRDQYINNITNVLKAQEIAGLPSIPEPPPDFTGRDAELQELLEKFESGVNIIGLRGIGGVGKTALAFKLVELLRDRYTDGQVMVDMDGTGDNPATPSQAMASVIHAYHSQEKIPDNEADVRILYLKVLEGKRALILLDNALDDRQVLKLVPPKTCGLIITSRRTIKLPGLFRKDLDVLEQDKALELLLSVWFSTSDSDSEKPSEVDPAWPEIALLCGYLPLALRAAASYLANYENISPARYAEELKDERTRLERIGEQGVERGVDACFNLSFQRLDQSTKQTFLNLTVFPSDFDGPAEEQICRDVGNRDLSELVRWSFVDYRHLSPDYGRYRLHDLARLFALARISAESLQSVHQDHAAYYQELLSLADSMYQEGGDGIQTGLDLFDLEKTNILAGQSWAEKNLENSPGAASLCSSYPDTGVYVLDLRLHPSEKIRWLETAMAVAKQLQDRNAEGAHLGNLGNAYTNLGETRKSIEYYEQALVIAKEIGDRRGEGAALGNLGLAYAGLGDIRKAIEYYEQALAIAREIDDRRDEGGHLDNLGLAHAGLGDIRKAIEYYEQALAIAREIGDRRSEGAALGNLGLAYADLGETCKAIEYYEQALAIAREIGDRRGEGADLGNLGLAYADLGKTRKAIEHYERALKINKEIGNKRGEGNCLGNLGNTYRNFGKLSKATEYYEQALAIAMEIGDRRGEGGHLGNLGLAYAALGDIRKAIEYYEQALTISREIGYKRGEEDHLGNLGLAYAALGDIRKAIECYERALTIAREIGDKRGEGNHLGNLGSAYYTLSETRKAIEHYEQALKISREIGDRRGEGANLGNLGNAYANLGEPSKAIEHYEQALAIAREIGDRRNEGAWLGNLGLAYADLGEPSKAIEYYEQALAIARDISDRRNEGNWLGNLGNAYRDLGQTRKAVEHYKQALKISREIGDRRGEGADLGNLGNAYRDLGETSKAIKHYEQAVKISREIGDRRDEGNHLGNLGAAYADLGEPRKAIEHYEQHLAIAREIGDRNGEAIACWNLSLEYEKAGDLKQAAELMPVCVDYKKKIGHPDAEKDAQRLDDILDRLKRR